MLRFLCFVYILRKVNNREFDLEHNKTIYVKNSDYGAI